MSNMLSMAETGWLIVGNSFDPRSIRKTPVCTKNVKVKF